MSYFYAIIDSQVPSSLEFKDFMDDYSDFELCNIVQDHDQGMRMILKHLPDVIFFHFKDNDTNSYFNMLNELHRYVSKMPILIAYSTTKIYAYEALKFGFFDYLISSSIEFELRKSIFKLRKERPKEETPKTICLKTYRDFHYLETDEILFLQADNNATDFLLLNGKKISAYKTLKSFEEVLPSNFVRIHQSYILNSDYVSRINYGKGICALKHYSREIPFSKTYKSKIDELQIFLSNNAIRNIN